MSSGSSCLSWKDVVIGLLLVSAGMICLTGLTGLIGYGISPMVTPPNVKLTSAVVSASNATSLLIDADWLLTFGLDTPGRDYGALEASLLYDLGGGRMMEVAAGRLPPFHVGWEWWPFSIRLRPAAGDGRRSAAVQVLGDMIENTGSVEFQVRLNGLSWEEDFIFKWKISAVVDCHSVRIEFLNPRQGAVAGGGYITGVLATPTKCHTHGGKIIS
ncbi:unnamed protein product [Linum trigynum]|uniref:Late embryogenesis abundant protein LEA-2 subgroup domain-containing protein n=1 Tax=Linum trigynum TaxID=586398 RepID=A0AAV2FHZ6_9ROSI